MTSLKPDPANPKLHDLDTIGASIGRFGMLEPIVLDGRTGQIVSGHGRVLTLIDKQERGDDPPEGVPVRDGRWLAPVVTGWASKDDDDAHAALVALNRTVETGGWDERELLRLLDGLSGEDPLLGVGFGEEDLTRLRESVLADDSQAFLGDLVDRTAENPFEEAPWGANGAVSLAFPMSAEQRTACMAVLRQTIRDHELPTLTDALLHHLGIEEAA